MSDTEPLITDKNTGNKIFENFRNFLMNLYYGVRDFFKKLSGNVEYTIPSVVIFIGVLFIFLGPCLLNGFKSNFTNEIEQVTQEPEEPCHDGTDSNLINTPLCSEKTYQNTSLENTSPSDFEVVKNFDILETNNILSVKERIDGYIDQPTFLPGKFN